MIIGVDFDEVLADTWSAVIKFHNERHGTAWQRAAIRTSKFWEGLGETQEESYRKVDEFCQTNYFKNIQPVIGSRTGVRQLRRRGHELVIITTRPGYLARATEIWLDCYFPGQFAGVFHSPEGGKSDLCLEHQAKILIEDDWENASECAAKGIRVLLLDSPWNQSSNLGSLITRVSSWAELMGVLKIC